MAELEREIGRVERNGGSFASGEEPETGQCASLILKALTENPGLSRAGRLQGDLFREGMKKIRAPDRNRRWVNEKALDIVPGSPDIELIDPGGQHPF